MYCTNCGVALPEDARFCPQCGTPRSGSAGLAATTTAFEPLGQEPYEGLDDLPELEPGTGVLVVVRGPSVGARFLLDHDVITIGRHAEADLLLDDVTVSRNHAEVVRTPDGMVLRDAGSMNGTYVGGERVDEHPLATGDEVQIGRFKLIFVGAATA
jgi:hypothetical protein